ncbi:hypothetical protein Q7P35_005063 [Cladosporium inversicolor]
MENRASFPAQSETLCVPVHSFVWCPCGRDDFPAHHLNVKTRLQPVRSKQAIALTYGIGDFERRNHVFGHFDDGALTQKVDLEFGGEWDIERIMEALVDLSRIHGAIWMDQLSIPQDAVSIAISLQNMPQIYRTFEVVVLLPDALCSCLEEVIDSYGTGHSSFVEGGWGPNLDKVVGICLNAFPVSSYHFRLWTKQEFTYARTISIRYCGARISSCSRIVRDWIHYASKDLLSDGGHLNRWSRWKYGQCLEQARKYGDNTEEVAYSDFRQAQIIGRTHLFMAVASFYLRKYRSSRKLEESYTVAKFILGAKLQREQNDGEAIPIFENLHSEHVASEPRDFALAVLPAIKGYYLPERWQEMTLPELVDDGLHIYERGEGMRCQTRLPKGLFEPGPGSMRCKPSLYLRTDNICTLKDVYGAIHTLTYPTLPGYDDFAMLRLRSEHRTLTQSRLSQAMTYSEAFGGKSTMESLDFIRKVRHFDFGMFGKIPFGLLPGWADKLLSGGIAAPAENWPSPAHEKAIFTQSLHRASGWGLWPDVDHERVCFELLCDFVCIDPTVAKEKRFGLVAKTADPPCLGFVNRAVYEDMQRFENEQRSQGVDVSDFTKSVGDCLTVVIGATASARQTRFVTVEAMKTDTSFDAVQVDDRLRQPAISTYRVVGVWFFTGRDDPCIGAELSESSVDCDAILI